MKKLLENLDRRGEIDTHVQPEVFYIDPKRGMRGLKKVLNLSKEPRVIEGVDIAHLGGTDTVASLVQFLTVCLSSRDTDVIRFAK